jgi:hypothetical protein
MKQWEALFKRKQGFMKFSQDSSETSAFRTLPWSRLPPAIAQGVGAVGAKAVRLICLHIRSSPVALNQLTWKDSAAPFRMKLNGVRKLEEVGWTAWKKLVLVTIWCGRRRG